ncbi:GGDEF domain-containing protein [Ectothiorhodospira lacustris]|uniref:GGDEF domain-containing protein n=1 Tax=Ectothiorhodospira lacustris TaxID=2899127 RepID=UPI001EE8BD1B|nr:GGDEF domain-containing protein [Ectothiorhodospira lacustris]MCG5508757.1 GGDEF domain-containing protein [Ectothiorhodospira lacustris]MCG5520548.1 GGDEF domain-containing protein [Ectothiorhodospira lacustris]
MWLQEIQQFAAGATTVPGVKATIQPLLGILQRVTGLESVFLTRISKGTQTVLFSHNTDQLQILAGMSPPWEDTLCSRALADERLLVNLILADEPVAPIGGDGQLLIAVSNYLSLLAIRLRDYEQLQAANRELTRFALNDPLTGLPNRRYLFETAQRLVSQTARLGESVVVLFIDLDGFKQINDRFGHRSGDHFLVQFGRRLSAALREGDFAARYGGDEFVVLAVTPGSGDDMESQLQARQFADRIGLALMGTFDLDGAVIDYMGPSIGTVIWESDESVEALLHRADKAMYAEKIQRRGPPPFTA